MKYLHQEKTFQKARDFSAFLNRGEFRAIPDIDGTRDYLSRIDVYAAGLYIGKLNVYYSPKKNRYSITTQSVTVPSYRDVLQEQWQQFLDTKHPSDDRLCAYVDGSFMNGCVGYGAVIVQNGRVLHEISGCMTEDYNSLRQIGGELKAVLETVKWCKDRKINTVHVFYDYKGIEMWATGRWKAKKALTQAYRDYMARQDIGIRFHKVGAHSGDRWNDYADKLAKKGTEKRNAENTTVS